MTTEEALSALEKWNEIFGFARLYRTIGGWAVSNKTDEGIGGSGPYISIYGKTPAEAVLAAAKYITEDLTIPAPLKCPNCGQTIPISDYDIGRENPSIRYYCGGCFESYCEDDICPECWGALDVIDDEASDLNRPIWESKCKTCGKVYKRGKVEMQYPEWVFEKLVLIEPKAPDTVCEDDDDL
jgi:ribosomal protein L32